MTDTVINPLDYATEFALPAQGTGCYTVTRARRSGLWVIADVDGPNERYDISTVGGQWIPVLQMPHPWDPVAVGFERDRAIAAAYRLAATGVRPTPVTEGLQGLGGNHG